MVRINPENPAELQFKSIAMGHFWFHRYTSKKMGKFIEIEFEDSTLALLAKTETGLFYSTNGGLNWRKKNKND